MKIKWILGELFVTVLFACLIASCRDSKPAPAADSAPESIESVLTEANQPFTHRELLVELGVLEVWTEEDDRSVFLDEESDLGSVTRIYLGKDSVKSYYFTGKLTEAKTEDIFEVIRVGIEYEDRFDVYRWNGDQYFLARVIYKG